MGGMAFYHPVLESVRWLFVSQGRTREMRNWGLIESAVSIIFIMIGLIWGTLGVVSFFVLSGLLIKCPLAFYFAGKRGPVKQKDYYILILPLLIITMITSSVILGVKPYLEMNNIPLSLATTCIISFLCYLLLLNLFPTTRSSVKEIYSIVFRLLHSKGHY